MDTQTIIDEVHAAVSRINFPARKGDIVGAAQDVGAGEETMGALQQLPEQKFNTVQEVLEHLPLGDIESQIDRFL